MISSDRSSACCLELFAVSKAAPVAPPVMETKPVAPVVAEPVEETPKVEIVVENNRAMLQHVLFELDSYELDEKGRTQLDAVVEYLVKHPALKVEFGAHTDGTGTKAHNLKLSQQRAEACVSYLASKGIEKTRMVAKGYGACCPVQTETTPDGKDIPEAREVNRRMEMKIIE